MSEEERKARLQEIRRTYVPGHLGGHPDDGIPFLLSELDRITAERDKYRRLAVPAVFDALKAERDAALEQVRVLKERVQELEREVCFAETGRFPSETKEKRKLPDLGTCIHGTPTMVPCPTCDARYGPVDASDAVKLRHCHATLIETERQLAEAQAQIGAMSVALKEIAGGTKGEGHGYDASFEWLHRRALEALAPEARKELLARLEKAEGAVVRLVREQEEKGAYRLGWERAKEEAAKVAEKTDAILQLPTGSEWVGKALAAAIRTLATAPKGET